MSEIACTQTLRGQELKTAVTPLAGETWRGRRHGAGKAALLARPRVLRHLYDEVAA